MDEKNEKREDGRKSQMWKRDRDGRKELYENISRDDHEGGDKLLLWGKGSGKKQVMYIRCK